MFCMEGPKTTTRDGQTKGRARSSGDQEDVRDRHVQSVKEPITRREAAVDRRSTARGAQTARTESHSRTTSPGRLPGGPRPRCACCSSAVAARFGFTCCACSENCCLLSQYEPCRRFQSHTSPSSITASWHARQRGRAAEIKKTKRSSINITLHSISAGPDTFLPKVSVGSIKYMSGAPRSFHNLVV